MLAMFIRFFTTDWFRGGLVLHRPGSRRKTIIFIFGGGGERLWNRKGYSKRITSLDRRNEPQMAGNEGRNNLSSSSLGQRFRTPPATPALGNQQQPNNVIGSAEYRAGQRTPNDTAVNKRQEARKEVGFANYKNEVFRKAVKTEFEFTLMVVGRSGLGKSTYINSLFFADLKSGMEVPEEMKFPTERTMRIDERTFRLKENNITLLLTLVDTPGYGDAIDNSRCWEPIGQFVDGKYADYYTEENKVHRQSTLPDRRVHCCLYFIAPSGHGLTTLDVAFLKGLHEKVNVIPVIAKADTFTMEECNLFKEKIARELREHGIRLYRPPDTPDGQTPLPFAVVGGTKVGDGKLSRTRKYPWGTVEIDNTGHNDFVALRDMIIRKYMIDLIDITSSVHYENYRYRTLTTSGFDDSNHPAFQMEEAQKEHAGRMTQLEAEVEKKLNVACAEEEMEKVQMEKAEKDSNQIQRAKMEIHKKLRDMQRRREAFEKELQRYQEVYPQYKKYASNGNLDESSSTADTSKDSTRRSGTLGSVFGKKNSTQP